MDAINATHYSLHDILAVASNHPFYQPDIQYPPDAGQISRILKSQADGTTPSLADVPLTYKKNLYDT